MRHLSEFMCKLLKRITIQAKTVQISYFITFNENIDKFLSKMNVRGEFLAKIILILSLLNTINCFFDPLTIGAVTVIGMASSGSPFTNLRAF